MGNSKIDTDELIGKRFGKLTVAKYSGYRNGKYYYECSCDCGRSVSSHRGRLLSGGSTSCGCDREWHPDPAKFIGRRFGKLVVKEDLGTSWKEGSHRRYYNCICDCGGSIETTRTRLLNGEVSTCGKCSEIVADGDHYKYYCQNGQSFIFDEEDLELVKRHRWFICNGYPVMRLPDGRQEKLTRMMFGLDKNDRRRIDHINRDPSDERRCNLRISEQRENIRNTKLRSDNRSGYKGVYYRVDRGKYSASIKVDGRKIYLGNYLIPEDAARAYDEAARFYFGEFACVNFPREGERGCRPAEVLPMFDVYEDFEDLDAVI